MVQEYHKRRSLGSKKTEVYTFGLRKFILICCLLFVSTSYAESTLTYCSEGSPDTFNPQRSLSGTTRNATAHTIYDRLVDFKLGTTNLIPSLAESWEISKDNKVYKFKLRKGVQFQTTDYFTPTREFTADDVVFSINRQLNKQHPYHLVGGGVYQYFQGVGMDHLIRSVDKIDDYTVQITLNKPEATFLANLAMPFMSILSAEYAAKLLKAGKPEQLDQLPIGTGPFAFKRYIKDSTIRYTAHDKYWRGKPKLTNLVFSITPEASVRYQKLKNNECQIIVYPAPSQLELIKKDKKLRLLALDEMNIGYLALNTEKKPLNNVLVRRAIAHALNKQFYIKAIYMNNAQVAINPYPPTMWSYTEDITKYDYNPAKAKALLAEAGYPNGFNLSLWTLPVTRPFNPNGMKMGVLMQQDLAKVGIKVNIKAYDWGTYLEKIKNGEHDMVQLGWTGDNGDPDNFLYTLLSCDSVTRGSNNSRYCQKKFDDLITEARTVSDRPVRTDLYKQALNVLSQDIPIIPIAHSKVFRAMTTNVRGYVMDPLDMDNFFDLSLDS
jgi:dipeptide transport system substrate-binding protein